MKLRTSTFFLTLGLVYSTALTAQQNPKNTISSDRRWFMASDFTSVLRPNSGFNLQSGFQQKDRIYTMGLDMFTDFNFWNSDKYHGSFGDHFQIAISCKYLKERKKNQSSQKYNGFEISYGQAKFEKYNRVFQENGVWKEASSVDMKGAVPGIVFLQSRTKIGYILGYRYHFKSHFYFDCSLLTGISIFNNHEYSYPYKYVNKPSYNGPTLLPAGYFDGLNAIGSMADALLTHAGFDILDSGIALALQGRLVVGYSF